MQQPLLHSGPADPDDERARRSQRLVRRSRVLSYVLVAIGVVVLSFAPSVLGRPDTEVGRVLLDVVRPIVGAVFVLAALGVQVVVGIQWRRDLRRPAPPTPPQPGSDHPDPTA